MEIEGLSFDALKALPAEDLEALLAFGKPITFRMGTATILAEFNKVGADLIVKKRGQSHLLSGDRPLVTEVRQ